jgi:predicted DNA-binding ribbon-helix-helix protein
MAVCPPFGPPKKRSVTIAGHETSIALEPIFWAALEDAAATEKLPLNALIARIDAERLERSPPANLASAIRQWLFVRASSGLQDGIREQGRGVGRAIEP